MACIMGSLQHRFLHVSLMLMVFEGMKGCFGRGTKSSPNRMYTSVSGASFTSEGSAIRLLNQYNDVFHNC